MAVSLSFHGGSTLLHCLNNVLITGTTTNIAVELVSDLLLSRIGVMPTNIDSVHDHTRRTVATLQSMALFKRCLHGVQRADRLAKPFYGSNLRAINMSEQHIE
jgi:hypothetical protein